MKSKNINSTFKWINKTYLLYFLWIIVITVFHIIFLDLFAIMDVTPDLFIIIVVWITLKEGRLAGILAGFVIGLYLDIISADVVGTNAFSKTIAAFIVSYFYKENKINFITKGYQFILISFLATLIHNIVYFFFYIKTSEQDFLVFYLKYGLATTAYTTVFAILVVLFQMPSNRIKINV